MKTSLNRFSSLTKLLTLLPPLLLMGLLLFAREIRPRDQMTTVLLVSRAEKSLNSAADAPLTSTGQSRALALAELLERRGVAAVFTPPVASCRATVAPLAQTFRLTPFVYKADQPAALASRITRQYAGKTVVVVGEPAALLPLVDALGAPRPAAGVSETDYDLLLEIRLPADSFPMVLTRRYGAAE